MTEQPTEASTTGQAAPLTAANPGPEIPRANSCIALELVYDDSDSMTDYYAPDRALCRFRVLDLPDRGRITEPVLRRALERLPAWLQAKAWTYRKGEKYSMSDHPYGQLRGEVLEGMKWDYGYGGRSYDTKALQLLLDAEWKLGEEADAPVPQSLEEMAAFVQHLGDERKKQEAELEAKRNSPEGKAQRLRSEINQWHSLTAVFDERGFHTITAEERAAKIAALEEELHKLPPAVGTVECLACGEDITGEDELGHFNEERPDRVVQVREFDGLQWVEN